jgi:MarR family transcriptional regulator, organic hydroperoxide resistance regulator
VPRRSVLATEADELARLLREINRWYRDQTVEADIARSGLTIPQVAAISVLYEHGPLSLKDLSRELGLSHSTVSGIVDRLERQDLVVRRTDEADRRISRIGVTRQVDRYVSEGYLAGQNARLVAALKAATPARRKRIRDGIATLHALLREGAGDDRR